MQTLHVLLFQPMGLFINEVALQWVFTVAAKGCS